ncbi:MAG: formylglycine-generating enzyme family protein [Gammaproteobacteria bacterium]|nr:formylglycine-generating enzyme family protein [Gammaproteobacteria bacterium]
MAVFLGLSLLPTLEARSQDSNVAYRSIYGIDVYFLGDGSLTGGQDYEEASGSLALGDFVLDEISYVDVYEFSLDSTNFVDFSLTASEFTPLLYLIETNENQDLVYIEIIEHSGGSISAQRELHIGTYWLAVTSADESPLAQGGYDLSASSERTGDSYRSIYGVEIFLLGSGSLTGNDDAAEIDGTLESGDFVLNGRYADVYEFSLESTNTADIALTPSGFSPLLYLARINADQELISIEAIEASGGTVTAQRQLHAGAYWVVVTSGDESSSASSAYKLSVRSARSESPYVPGAVFTDNLASGGSGPEMVVIPSGSFLMGSSENWSPTETPVHRVTIGQNFAVSKYEVTFAQWYDCVVGGGCSGYSPDDAGWGRGDRPVIYISWHDAQEYVAWLSRETGGTYRLLSEAEWEYATRAGSTTSYSWGDEFDGSLANLDGNRGRTVPVGSFPANAFGLHDMHGNVYEWVEDCWNENYHGAPADGSAWLSGNCSERIFRGGSWYWVPSLLRSAYRGHEPTGHRSKGVGFRVARTLTP